MPPNHDLLPRLRSRLYTIREERTELEIAIGVLQAKVVSLDEEHEQVLQAIQDNGYYRPPPRPSI